MLVSTLLKRNENLLAPVILIYKEMARQKVAVFIASTDIIFSSKFFEVGY